MATGNTRKRTSSGKKRTTKKQAQKKASFRNEVILWVVLAVCIILFLANFGLGGIVGNKLSSFFFGVFGFIAYIFPVCFFVATAFALSNRENKVATVKLIASVLFVAFLCLFGQMATDSGETKDIMEAFRHSTETKSGGGMVGGALEVLLYPNFGAVGTYVIDIIILIISLVLITERSAIHGLKKGGKVIYDSAKDDMSRRREIHEQKKEERAQLQEQKRIDKHVSGVALDTKLKPPKKVSNVSEVSDEISEIKIDDTLKMPEIRREEHIRLTSSKENDIKEPDMTETFGDFHSLFAEPENTTVYEGTKEEVVIEPVKDIAETETPVQAEPVKTRKRVEKQASEEIHDDVMETIQAASELESVISATKQYQFPPVSLLKSGNKNATGDSKQYLQETAMKLQQTLKNFGVNVTITNVSCGPSVTRYEIQPEMGVKVSKIVGLADDIKLNLAAADIRMEAPIPGKAAIGIEVPNKESTPVMFRELVESEEFKKHTSPIAFAAGKDIGGQVIVTDIAKMPHLLIAGATGSGKSVCINTIIMSILYRAHPDDVKLIMIDPKVVELSVYNGIPHLFIPVVTDPKKAAGALHWAVAEMTDRYQKFADYGVRDLKGYNQKVENIKDIEDPEKPKKMPQIVIIVDELADLMMVAPGDVEDAICRLAQLARAAGIHLIIATQRPSVNVITGLIKANMPSRIAFSVTSGVDSRTILDMNGAEKLLGKGDMLFYPQGLQKPMRAQGAFVSDKEVADVVDFIKNQNEEAAYSEEIEAKMNSISASSGGDSQGVPGNDRDDHFVDAAKLLIDKDKGSIGMLQRYFKVGFNRAARIMDQLEEAGIVGPDEGTKPRQVLMSPEQLEVYIEENL